MKSKRLLESQYLVTLQLKCTRTLTFEISTWPVLTSPPASIQRRPVTRQLRWPIGCASRSKTTLSKCCGRQSPTSHVPSRERCFGATAGQWRHKFAHVNVLVHLCCKVTIVLTFQKFFLARPGDRAAGRAAQNQHARSPWQALHSAACQEQGGARGGQVLKQERQGKPVST